MKSLGVCGGLLVGLISLPALAVSSFDVAQATPATPAAPAPPAAAPSPAAAPAAPAPPAAAAAPAKSKAKAAAKAKAPAGKKVPSIITVENKRTVTLKGLQISLPGGGKVVGKLAKEVAAGKTARVALRGAKGCEYDVKWEFEDATDESTADLCNDPRIVLTD
jgi:hypothetical protein